MLFSPWSWIGSHEIHTVQEMHAKNIIKAVDKYPIETRTGTTAIIKINMISKTKKSIATAGGLLNDSVKYLFQDRPKANLTKFIDEVNTENAEHMSYQKEFDESLELCPTYEQLNQDRINDQAAKNVMMLKSFEHILDERSQAFTVFLDNLIRARSSFDSFQDCEGTLRQALDALFVFVEQELQQARQQLSLGDLKRVLADIKTDVVARVGDYQVNATETI